MLEVVDKLFGKSYGGVACAKIEVVQANGIDTWPEHFNNVLQSAPTLKAGHSWITINFRRNTAQFSETPRNDLSQVYPSSIKAIISKDVASTINKLVNTSRLGLIVRFTDNNGTQKMMGSPDNPVRMKWDRDNKDNMLQANEMNLLFTTTGRFPVPECEF